MDRAEIEGMMRGVAGVIKEHLGPLVERIEALEGSGGGDAERQARRQKFMESKTPATTGSVFRMLEPFMQEMKAQKRRIEALEMSVGERFKDLDERDAALAQRVEALEPPQDEGEDQ